MPCFVGDGPELEACVVDHLRAQLDDLDARIAHLQHARTSLVDLLTASQRVHLEPTGATPAPSAPASITHA
ncbi:hypothetical protein [Pseudonocardia nigra]|uniref:hypothetical protein n=1 Tax=Pseudonocardia nigra TaxID=1921578 RepID=UPI0027E2A46C|nr:hypothetical protein [Pseudonocardia nigra]